MEAHEPASGGSSAHILIVDAAEDERGMYALALRGQGYTVRESGDGEEGLGEIRAKPPDLVVADVVLPKLDGLQLLTAIRSNSRTKELPVIVLTGYNQPLSIITDAKAAGATTVRIKPCLPETLVRDVGEIFAESRRLRVKAQEVRYRSREARSRTSAALARSVNVATQACPACGASLESAGVVRLSLGHTYFRPCPQGCGWWYYDARAARMCKLV